MLIDDRTQEEMDKEPFVSKMKNYAEPTSVHNHFIIYIIIPVYNFLLHKIVLQVASSKTHAMWYKKAGGTCGFFHRPLTMHLNLAS